MALINEVLIGVVPEYNGMTMYRMYDSEKGFIPYFKFLDNNTMSVESNIIINYIEIFKNSNGEEVPELRSRKYYVVPNRDATYYQEGDVLPDGKNIGDEKTPAWYAANNWFLSLARTPILAPSGIMDSIEATIGAFPMGIPNGYILQGA